MGKEDSVYDEVLRILGNFGIKKVDALSRGEGTASPKYIVSCPCKKYLLKKRRKEFSPPEVVRFDHSVIRQLAKEGFPVAVPVNSPESGFSAVYSGSEAWELFAYIEGLQPFVQGEERQIRSAAETLGRMHNALCEFLPEGEKPWEREFLPSSVRSELLKYLDVTPRVFDKNDKIIKEVIGELDSLVEEYSSERLTHTIVHGDYTSANIKFIHNRVGAIFDFDWTSRQNTLYDISRGLVYFSFTRGGCLDGGNIRSLVQPARMDIEKVKIFLAAYRKEFIFTETDAENLPFALKEFFLGARIRALRKVPDIEKKKMLDDSLLDMLRTVDREKNRLTEAIL